MMTATGQDTVAAWARGPSSPAPVSASRCSAVLLAVATIVGAAHLASSALVKALPLWTGAVDPAVIAMSAPMLIGVYQLAFLALVVRWFDQDRATFLALVRPSLKLWQWAAIIIGVYALKAIASMVLLSLFAKGGIGGSAGAGKSAVDSLAPFAAVMKSNAWPLLLIGGVLAAIVEEMIYRGFLSRTLEGSRLGFWSGALLASVVWAGLHVYYPLGLQAVLVILGLALSWLRRRTGSIYPGMAWHIVNNVVALAAMRVLV
jgi:membrane protease YdiL (CAAX protease family)